MAVAVGLALSGCDAVPLSTSVPAAAETVAAVPGAAVPGAAVPGAAVPGAPLPTTVAPTSGFAGLLNARRASGGLPAATADPRLTAAAQAHAQDMVTRNYFAHRSPEGTSSADRVRTAGYSTCRPSENIAFGQATAAAVLADWLTSPGHLANIMMRGPVQFGLGHAGDKWVLVVAGVC